MHDVICTGGGSWSFLRSASATSKPASAAPLLCPCSISSISPTTLRPPPPPPSAFPSLSTWLSSVRTIPLAAAGKGALRGGVTAARESSCRTFGVLSEAEGSRRTQIFVCTLTSIVHWHVCLIWHAGRGSQRTCMHVSMHAFSRSFSRARSPSPCVCECSHMDTQHT